MIYKGNTKIQDTGAYGIYHGSTPIGAVYKGSKKVYLFEAVHTWQAGTTLAEYIVPAYVSKIHVDVVGSKGYGGGSNKGGRVQCDIDVNGGQILYITVGNARTGNNWSYNASDIRTNNDGLLNTASLQSRLVVGAGGGNRANWGGVTNYDGGNGGGLTGATGGGDHPGGGGTQTSGGSGGSGNFTTPGASGAFGTGSSKNGEGGCGGAGWYSGGQGAQFQYLYDLHASGGGGGSSYANSEFCSNVDNKGGYQAGAGYITITEIG